MSELPNISVIMETQSEASLLLKGGIESDHERLSNRHKVNQHTISAITGLTEFTADVNSLLGIHSERITKIENTLTAEGIHEIYCNYYDYVLTAANILPSFSNSNFKYEGTVTIMNANITDDSEVGVLFQSAEEQLYYGIAFLNAQNITTSADIQCVKLKFLLVEKPISGLHFFLKITGGELKYD